MRRNLKVYRRVLLSCLLALMMLNCSADTGVPGAGKAEKPEVLSIPDVPDDKVICFALYTVHDNILKLTAQLYPLDRYDDRTVRLEIRKNGRWTKIAETRVIEQGWTAPFRIENWDSTRDYEYRVAYGKNAYFTGTIRRDPVDKEEIVVAAFTGNSNKDRRMKPDIIRNIKYQDPDLLFFSGDQVYDHDNHLAAWLLFGRQFGEIIRDRPTVTIPDDHDVGQGNLWGEGGRRLKYSLDPMEGGYIMPPEYVNEVQRAQTSHLPDPYDPTPVKQGIGVYYTRLTVGRVDFAILEDRKFKSRPTCIQPGTVPEGPNACNVGGPELLGGRQMKFLRDWAADWRGADMKAVLSQTIFANAQYSREGDLKRDYDSNGWPPWKRDEALREIRKAFALHIAGDRHLATVIHYGIDDWDDAGWSFCVPSIVNFWPRYWNPPDDPVQKIDGVLDKLGRYRDGFGNRITMHAYYNPSKDLQPLSHKVDPADPRRGADGYGIVRFNKKRRTITMECWPRLVDVSRKDAKQCPGWPVTVTQEDNYGRKAVSYLPVIEVSGPVNPVIQIIDESTGEIVYTIRIKGTSYRPKVFREGSYTVRVGEGESAKVLKNIKSTGLHRMQTIKVVF